PLIPYTTLFRSDGDAGALGRRRTDDARHAARAPDPPPDARRADPGPRLRAADGRRATQRRHPGARAALLGAGRESATAAAGIDRPASGGLRGGWGRRVRRAARGARG